MLNSKNRALTKKQKSNSANKYKRLISMGEVSKKIINDLSTPIDATNRFINLALHSVGEGSQSRQFLLDSKQGIRETADLLKRLNNYAKKMETELVKITERTRNKKK